MGNSEEAEEKEASPAHRLLSWTALKWGLGVIALVVTWYLASQPLPENCDFHLHVALTGNALDLREYLEGNDCETLSLGEARLALGYDVLFIVAYMFVVARAIASLWDHAWRTRRLLKIKQPAIFLAVATGAVDFLENVCAFLFLSDSDGLEMSPFGAMFTSVFGWWKWSLAVLTIMALVLSLFGAIGNRYTARATRDPLEPKPTRGPDGIGICLSGGGIRSASFALGGLQGLDEHNLFQKSRWLAAVSGGAYTAGAWWIARGTPGEVAKIQPQATPQRDWLLDKNQQRGTPNRFEYVRTFRQYVATGRGGLSIAVIMVIVALFVNLAVLFALLYAVSYPLGWLTDTWAIHPRIDQLNYSGVFAQTVPLPLRLWLPGLVALGLGLAAWFFSLFFYGSTQRKAVKISIGLLSVGMALIGFLVGIPWVLTHGTELMALVSKLVPSDGAGGGAGFLSLLASLGITGALVRIATKPLARQAPRLGGVLLAVLALVVGGKIAADAAFDNGAFKSEATYLIVLAGFAAFYLIANPQLWSPHVLYHARLRTTFATTQDRSKRVVGAPSKADAYPIRYADEATWPDYDGREEPELIVCAAVQMRDNPVTEIPALSFTFSAKEIGYHAIEWESSDEQETIIKSYFVPAQDYVKCFAEKSVLRKRILGTVSAGVAMSGAAFTSAMGRQSLGTTNSLLAVLNARLGVWMPNPRCISSSSALSFFKKPRINYLVKEVLGVYDLNDPYVYVTDGGHWENLGLVELVRRRARVIFCIDASGDAPHSFTTLLEAITLARYECKAEIEIDLSPMKPGSDVELPQSAVAVGIVRYHTGSNHHGPDSCPIGVLFFGKATIGKDAPLRVQSFGLRDRIFPRYPTYDQFLEEDQFDHLVELGRCVASQAATLYKSLNVAASTGGPLGPGQDVLAPAVTEIREWQQTTGGQWPGP